jgi:D-glycero-D-manno-heptose 1,7-bisphosphate phosphatase
LNQLKRPAVFLDRDGTLIEDVGYPHRPEDLRLLAGVAPALLKLQKLGFVLVVVTNQSGVARGHFSEVQMHAFHKLLGGQLSAAGVRIDAFYYCPFHPDAALAEYRRDSPLRKPLPGMLLLAAEELRLDLAASFAIGDKKSDVLAGQAAGCKSILLQTGKAGGDEPNLAVLPELVAADLAIAADWICANRENAIPHYDTSAYSAGPKSGHSAGVEP